MALFGGSKKTTENNYTTTNTSEVNQQEGLLNLAKDSRIEGSVQISNGVVESNDAMRAVSETALEQNAKVVSDSLALSDHAIESNGNLAAKGFTFAESLVSQQTANSNKTTLAISDLAKSLATGGVSDTAKQSQRTIYALVALSAVVVVIVLVRGK